MGALPGEVRQHDDEAGKEKDEDDVLNEAEEVAGGNVLCDSFEGAEPHAVGRLEEREGEQHHGQQHGPGNEAQARVEFAYAGALGNGGHAFFNAAEEARIAAPAFAHDQREGEPQTHHGRNACAGGAAPRRDGAGKGDGARESGRQDEGGDGHEAEGSAAGDHLLHWNAHAAAGHKQVVNEADGEQHAERNEEPAAPAIGGSGAHHHEEERDHEGAGDGCGGERLPLRTRPWVKEHEQRPEEYGDGEQKRAGETSLFRAREAGRADVSSHWHFSQATLRFP